MRLPVSVLLVTLLLAAAGGCKKEKSQDKAGAGEAASSDELDAVRADRRQRRAIDPEVARRRGQALRRMTLAPITLEEVTPLLPSLPDAEPVGKPGPVGGGRQVKAILCARSESAGVTAQQLVTELERLGFDKVRQRPHPRNPDVVTIAAEKAPLRLGATVQRGPYADCPASSSKAKVILSYFKRAPAGDGSAAPGTGDSGDGEGASGGGATGAAPDDGTP